MKRHGSMNHIFRLVWSHVLQSWVAVAENTRGQGKGKSSRRKLIAAALALTAVTTVIPEAMAGPAGGKVVAGSATINQKGSTTTIDQTSQDVTLNWNSFNIAPQETVDFVQPSSSSLAVNYILGNNGTQILGHLNANGQVYLINPNGILFGQGSQVNVGGLVASTLNLVNDNAGLNTVGFSGIGSGSIVNQGTITAKQGGYVALVGNTVNNHGTVTAQLGSVALGAGSAVTLTFNGNNLVHLQVDKSTLDNLAANGGLIKADGGLVVMSAGAKNALLASVVNNTGVIEAQTVSSHDGTIELMGSMQAGTVQVGGTLDASAPNGGHGGNVTTDAANVIVANNAKISTAATQGASGLWTIDPTNFTITPDSSALTASGMGNATLVTALNSGSVSIATSSAANGTDLGDINVNAPVIWSNANSLTLTALNNINVNAAINWGGNGSSALTLNAQNNININSAMSGATGASLALQFGQSSVSGAGSSYNINAPVNLPSGNNYSTQQGSTGTPIVYTVINSLGAAADATGGALTLQGIAASANLSGNFALGSNIDATATSGWNNNAGFTPIGILSNSFSGNFDGLGHTISNLTINTPANSYVGLFGVSNTATIQNVGLVNENISGLYGVGGLVGYAYENSISNSSATGSVTSGANASYVGGLVGYAYEGSINNSYATGSVTSGATTSYVGGLVGSAYGGIISNSHATGPVVTGTASGDVGGLIGFAYKATTITNSYATGSISGGNGSVALGGLLGAVYEGTISNSYATGSVNGGSDVGGLVGYSPSSTISNSYATGAVTGGATSSNIGGLVGYAYGSGTISNSYATGSVSGGTGSEFVGGLVGANSATISNVYSVGSVTSSGFDVGGLVGYNTGTVTNGYWNATIFSGAGVNDVGGTSTGAGLTTTQMQTAANFSGFSLSTNPGATGNNWVMVDVDGTLNNAGGALGATYPMLASEYSTSISNAHQLQLITMAPSASYTLANNINAVNTGTPGSDVWSTGMGFVPIGNASSPFTGTLNGAGYAISNLTIDAPSMNGVGLFDYANAATIQNVGLVNDNVTGFSYVGGLVGEASGVTISNSYATGEVTADANNSSYIGGLVGYATQGVISNSYSTGPVSVGTSAASVGGLVGDTLEVTISNSYATGTVSAGAGSGYIGGLVGLAYAGTISNSYATGSVSAGAYSAYVGGLVGGASGGGVIGNTVAGLANISNSYATGAVSSGNGSVDIGGLVGFAYGTISNSYAAGAVTGGANSSQIGGLVGYAYGGGTISNSYATGAVSSGIGAEYLGGLVGLNSAAITNVYSIGSVTGSGSEIGGLIGNNTGTVTNGYWNSTIFSGVGVNNGGGTSTGAGLTTTQMQTVSNFAGFNFSTTPGATGNNWVMMDVDGTLNNAGAALGATYPMLTSEYSTTINNAHQLELITMAPSASYTLANNINAVNTGTPGSEVWSTSMGFVPIGTFSSSFTGTFNGSGFAISNLTINAPTNNDVGLFDITRGATIKNVGLVNDSIAGFFYVGGLVGEAYGGFITNSYATGAVIGGGINIGGLVGYAYGASISNSHAAGSVTGGANSYCIGGLVGYAYGASISNSYATAVVTGGSQAGGLVGAANGGGNISNNYAAGSVSGTNQVGGLVGESSISITNSYAAGSGTVTGTVDVGGLVGYNPSIGTISDSYAATGNVSGTGGNVGGLVGYSPGTVTASFWNTTTTNQTISAGGTGLSTAQMMTTSNFANAGWSIANTGGGGSVWRIYDGSTMPLLDSFLTPLTITANNIAVTYSNTTPTPQGVNYSIVAAGSSGHVLGLGYGTATNASATPYSLAAYSDQQGYDITFNGGGLTINPEAITVSSSNVIKTYDGTTTAIGAPVVTSGTLYNGDTLSGGTFAFTDANAGTANKTVTVAGVAVTVADSGNYTITDANNTTSTIIPEAITVSTSNVTKTYDGTTTAIGAPVVTGGMLYNGDTLSGGTYVFTNANAGNGNKTVTVAGVAVTDSGNYTVTNASNTTSTINPEPITVSTSNVIKTYDGTTTANGSATLISGSLYANVSNGNAQDVLSGGSFAYTDANAGTGKSVTVNSVVVNDGNNGNNYAISYVNNTASVINAEPITVSTGNVTKTYDGTTTAVGAPVVVSGNLYNSDTLSGGTYAFINANAGSGNKTVTVAGIAVTDSSNYIVTDTNNTTSTINPEPITVSTSNVTKTYDGTTTAIGAPVVTSGMLYNGDTISGGTYAFADANAGNASKTVTVAGVAITVADSANYTVTDASNTTSTITPAPLAVTANNEIKIFGAPVPTLSYTQTGTLYGSDTLSSVLSGTLSSSPGVNAGTYSINQGTLVSIDPNYSLTFNAGKLTIEPLVEPSAQTSGQTSPTPVLSAITPVAQLPVAYLDTATNKPVEQHIAVQDGKLAITVVDGGVRMPTNIMALQ